MEIINFEDAKAGRHSKTRKQLKVKKQSKARKQSKVRKQKVAKPSPEIDNGISELQRHYRELAQFYNQWYDEHVIGQDKDGRWIYKDL